jgi:hypothetical protein
MMSLQPSTKRIVFYGNVCRARSKAKTAGLGFKELYVA